jgi:Ca2+-binding EF-hand superfamily protein
MGCTLSSTTAAKVQSEASTAASIKEMKDIRKSATETKINQALLKKKMEAIVANKPVSFEKILLKFDKLRVVLGYVKQIFHEFATEGRLDHDGLLSTMKRLNCNMSLQDILDLFDFIDVQATNVVTYKEFIVALTIGMVLDAIPALANIQEKSPDGRPMIKRSLSGFMGHNHEIKEMLNLIVSAYLIFDPEGKGLIEKSSVEKMLDEHGQKAGKSHAVLSQQRWNEMVRNETFLVADLLTDLIVALFRTGMRMEQLILRSLFLHSHHGLILMKVMS